MIGVMTFVTMVQFMLAFYCRRFENKIVRAYAEHHSSNVVIGLAAAVLAIRYYWWIDPTGAIIVSSNATLLVFSIFSFSKPSQLPLTVFCKKKKKKIWYFHSLSSDIPLPLCALTWIYKWHEDGIFLGSLELKLTVILLQ